MDKQLTALTTKTGGPSGDVSPHFFGGGHGGNVPHFLRWGGYNMSCPPLFLFSFCILRGSKNKSDVCHILREVFFLLNVTHSQVDDETEFEVSLDTCVVSLSAISLDFVSLSSLASIK